MFDPERRAIDTDPFDSHEIGARRLIEFALESDGFPGIGISARRRARGLRIG